jgi:hypothetical protein
MVIVLPTLPETFNLAMLNRSPSGVSDRFVTDQWILFEMIEPDSRLHNQIPMKQTLSAKNMRDT